MVKKTNRKIGSGGSRLNAGCKQKYINGTEMFSVTIPVGSRDAMNEMLSKQREMYKVKSG